MRTETEENEQEALDALCSSVKEFTKERDFTDAIAATANAMRYYPHAPQPHNLLGIILEFEGDKVSAMRHYRAAWALDPTYRPARQNIERCGNLAPKDSIAFCEKDCVPKKTYWERANYDATI